VGHGADLTIAKLQTLGSFSLLTNSIAQATSPANQQRNRAYQELRTTNLFDNGF